MFLKCRLRRKDGKIHRSWSVVESRRDAGGKVAQRHVLYLGEINDSQRRSWEKTIAVFDEEQGETRQLALFPADRVPPAKPLVAIYLVPQRSSSSAVSLRPLRNCQRRTMAKVSSRQ